MVYVLFNSSVKTKIGSETDPKWKESQITKKFSFCALIGILPMAQNRPILVSQSIAEKIACQFRR